MRRHIRDGFSGECGGDVEAMCGVFGEWLIEDEIAETVEDWCTVVRSNIFGNMWVCSDNHDGAIIDCFLCERFLAYTMFGLILNAKME